MELNGFYYGPKISIPLGERFAIHGKVGGFTWDGDDTAKITGELADNLGITDYHTSDSGTDLFYGAGVAFDASSTVTLRSDCTRYALEVDNEDVDVDLIAAGLVLKFGKLL